MGLKTLAVVAGTPVLLHLGGCGDGKRYIPIEPAVVKPTVGPYVPTVAKDATAEGARKAIESLLTAHTVPKLLTVGTMRGFGVFSGGLLAGTDGYISSRADRRDTAGAPSVNWVGIVSARSAGLVKTLTGGDHDRVIEQQRNVQLVQRLVDAESLLQQYGTRIVGDTESLHAASDYAKQLKTNFAELAALFRRTAGDSERRDWNAQLGLNWMDAPKPLTYWWNGHASNYEVYGQQRNLILQSEVLRVH